MSARQGDAELPFALRARYVFPVSSPPIKDGALTIVGEDFLAGKLLDEIPEIDLGNVAILPGLVNAHTHLELSDLAAPLGSPGANFADWIRLVLAHREGRSPDAAERAIALGLAESLAAGVTALGDIDGGAWNPQFSLAGQPQVTVFRELIGLSPARIAQQVNVAAIHLAASWKEGTTPGLSPHAPYTANRELVVEAAALSRKNGAPLAMHLAESREELEFLSTLGGPLRQLLDERGIQVDGVLAPGGRPLDYLRLLAEAHCALVIHGNYLADDEWSFLAERRDRMSVVYCPRTHARFGHEPYPLEKALQLGVRVALGTDSRATNPDLDMLAEMRCAASAHPGLRPSDALAMATLHGAEALALAGGAGALGIGGRADFTIVRLPEHNAADPHELLLDPAAVVEQTWIAGREVFKKN